MKVFIYRKDNSKKVKIIKNVKTVFECDGEIVIDAGDESYTYKRY